MFSKRIRNKKLETNKRNLVYYRDELDPSLLIDYIHTNFKTGVEQEEEKEIHLKKMLESGFGHIAVPKITIDDDEIKTFSEYKPSKKYIKYEKDVRNEYMLKESDYKFLREENIDVEEFKQIVSLIGKKEYDKIENSPTKDKIINYYSKKMVKVIGNDDYDAYLCFRNRTCVPGRKTRRSEATILEKLKRMYTEFSYIDKLLQMKEEQQKINDELLSTGYEISGIIDVLKSSCGLSKRRKIYRKLYKAKKVKKHVPFYKTCGSFKELLTDRRKIYELKKTLANQKKVLNERDVENEIRVLSRLHKKRH